MKQIAGAALFLLSLSIGILQVRAENTVEMIEKVESATENPSGCPECLQPSAGDQPSQTKQASLMKSCVEAVCPSSGPSQAALEDAIAKRAADPVFDKEITPLLTEVAKEHAKDRVARAEALKAWINDAKDLTSDEGVRAFNFFRALERVGQFAYVNDGQNLRIDIEKSRTRFPQLTDEEMKRAVVIETRMLKQFTQRAIIETDPARLRLLYPGKRYRAAINGTIQQIESLGRLVERSPDTQFLMRTESIRALTKPELWKRYFENDTLNPEAVAAMNNMVSTLQLIIASSREPEFRAALQTKSIEVKKIADTEKFGEDLSTQETSAKKILEQTAPFDSPTCRRSFAEGQEVYPTEANLNAMRAGGADRIRTDFMKAVRNRLSKQSATVVEKAAQNWKPVLPPSREQHLANLKKRLQDAVAETKTQTRNFQQNATSKDRDLIFAMAVATRGHASAQSPTEKADEICNQMRPQLKPDGSLSNGFIVGPLTFLQGGQGKGYAGHELGHLLFQELMTASLSGETAAFFDQSRQCLLKNHTELTATEQAEHLAQYKRTGRSQFTEEDWIDGFDASAGGPNYGCFSIRQNQAQNYGDLSMKNSVPTDDHSSWLQRTLHMHHVQKGSIPEVCNEALRSRNESASFQNCFAKPGAK